MASGRRLLTEVVKAAMLTQPDKRLILDLCAGHQHMREVAEKLGLSYLAVDHKGELRAGAARRVATCL